MNFIQRMVAEMRRHKVATPVNWKHGDDVIITPAVIQIMRTQ